MSNLDLWNRVCKTDPSHTKPANVRGNKITAIAPQYQILKATEEFGPYGIAWGFEGIELDFTMLDKTGIVVFKGVFFYSSSDRKRDSFPIISSISAFKDGAMTKPDADFAKKVETDALTKALSKIGFNADVFMGRFDDHKYVEELRAKKAGPAFGFAVDNTAEQWIEAIKQDSEVINQIHNPEYKKFIEELLK